MALYFTLSLVCLYLVHPVIDFWNEVIERNESVWNYIQAIVNTFIMAGLGIYWGFLFFQKLLDGS